MEDNSGDARLIAEMLSDVRNFFFELKHATCLSDGLKHIGTNSFDIAILDLTLPDSWGLETVATVKTRANLPFIVLTGLDDEQTGIEAVKIGAQDFLVKGAIDGNLLVRSIRYAIERKRAEEEERKHQANIAALHKIEKAITSTLDLDAVLRVLMEKIDLVLPYAAVTLTLWNEGRHALEPIARHNVDEQVWKNASQTIDGVFYLADNSGPVQIRNIQTDPRVQNPEIYGRNGLLSYLGVPLVAKNKFLGVLGFFTDEEREFRVDEVEFLSTLAGQAAVAIHNSQLYEKTVEQAFELQESNRAKDDFLGIVSHELRTPVNVIMGYTKIFRERVLGELTDEQERALARMAICAEDLLVMIDDMLQVITLDNKSVQAASIEVDLNYFLEDLRSGYPVQCGKEVTLNWDFPADLPVIFTDYEKLKHILKHLINNAIKFTPTGQIVVSIRWPRENAMLEVEVADTGVGIPQAVLPKIFDKFHQGDNSTTREHGGCGLGLYIVKRLTELLRGNVTVKSEVGRGSIFALSLPIDECRHTEDDRSNKARTDIIGVDAAAHGASRPRRPTI